MDKLKLYLHEHRGLMDVEVPPTNLLPQIQAGAVAAASKALLIKYIISISVVVVTGTSAWLITQQQKPSPPPAPKAPTKEIIQKDTTPVQRDTVPVMPAQPVIKHKKKPTTARPTRTVIRKHKESVDTVNRQMLPRRTKSLQPVKRQTPPRPKKRPLLPIT